MSSPETPQNPQYSQNEIFVDSHEAFVDAVDTLTLQAELALKTFAKPEDKEKVESGEDVDISVDRPMPDDMAGRFVMSFLETPDEFNALGITRQIGEDGSVNYVMSRPGYKYSVLEYQWQEGGNTVRKGFTEGFAFEREGEEPTRETERRPVSLNLVEIQQLGASAQDILDSVKPKKSRDQRIREAVHKALKPAGS